MLIGLLSLLTRQLSFSAQVTAFTYQGWLNNAVGPVTGYYDFTFGLYMTNAGSSPATPILTNLNVGVVNGLFTTVLDFGAIFNGSSYWLESAVRKAGDTNGFITLSPRQAVECSPNAIYALSAASVSGVLSTTNLPTTVAFLNSSPVFTGMVSANGFSGNGSGLTNLLASSLTEGKVADAVLSGNVALLNGAQAFSGTNTFVNAINALASTNAISIYHPNASWYYSFGNGGWFAENSVAYARPSHSGRFAFDIIPRGGPSSTWIDICDTDVTSNYATNGEWLHLSKEASSFCSISSAAVGAGMVRPLVLQETGGIVGLGTTAPEVPFHVNGQDYAVPVHITSSIAPGILFDNQLDQRSSTAFGFIGVSTSPGQFLDLDTANDLCLAASSRLVLGTGTGIDSAGTTEVILSQNELIITNVPAYIETNLAPFTIDTTDIFINQIYTNDNRRLSLVASIGLGPGAAAGLYISKDSTYNWVTRIPVASSAPAGSTNVLSGWIQPSAVYCITNISSMGASVVSGSCQRVCQ